jgi:hypothetical protein
VKRKQAADREGPGPSPAAASEISAATFPALRQFLRGYLHEDWQEEHNSPAEAARQFCEEASPEERREVAREWEAFRQRTKNLSSPAISLLLSSQLGAAWNPKTSDQLEAVSAVFRPFAGKI